MPAVAAVPAGGHTDQALEVPREVTLVGESCPERDATGKLAGGREALGPSDAELNHIGVRRQTDVPGELADEVRRAQSRDAGQPVERDVLGGTRVEVVARPAHAAIRAAGLVGRGAGDGVPVQQGTEAEHLWPPDPCEPRIVFAGHCESGTLSLNHCGTRRPDDATPLGLPCTSASIGSVTNPPRFFLLPRGPGARSVNRSAADGGRILR